MNAFHSKKKARHFPTHEILDNMKGTENKILDRDVLYYL